MECLGDIKFECGDARVLPFEGQGVFGELLAAVIAFAVLDYLGQCYLNSGFVLVDRVAERKSVFGNRNAAGK